MSDDPSPTPSDTPTFDDLQFGKRSYRPSVRTVTTVVTLSILGAAFLYDLVVLTGYDPMFDGPLWPFEQAYDVTQLDWLLAFSVVSTLNWIVLPLVIDREQAMIYWRRLRKHPSAVLALGYLLALVFAGLLAPILAQPSINIGHSYQPPAFSSTDASVPAQCLGSVTADRCFGTLRYPLGTDGSGEGVLRYLLTGARATLAIGLITATVIVPLSTAVGTTAAYFGGWVDDALMRLVDVVQTIPPVIAYIMIVFILGGTGNIVLMVAVFGLLSWGNVARLVRSDALSRKEELFVTAAESAGGSRWYVIRRHVVPNVAGTVLTATTLQIPALLLTEVGLSYLTLGAQYTYSWGTLIASGTSNTIFGSLIDTWWISLTPVVALALTVLALGVLGDVLDEVVDPRIE